MVGGFGPIGYTDDRIVARRLICCPEVAAGAVCCDNNPDLLAEVFRESRWFGTSVFLRIDAKRGSLSLVRYCAVIPPLIAVPTAIRRKLPHCIVARTVFCLGVSLSLISPYSGHRQAK